MGSTDPLRAIALPLSPRRISESSSNDRNQSNGVVKLLQRTCLGTQRHPRLIPSRTLTRDIGTGVVVDLSSAVDLQHVPAFVVASTILMFIPGVDMALVTRQVVTQGRRAAMATLGGLLLGGLTRSRPRCARSACRVRTTLDRCWNSVLPG